MHDPTAKDYEPAFIDDEGQSDPPAHVCSELADQGRARRRVRALTPGERAELRQDMAEASAWMRAELARRRAMNN